MAKPDSSLVAYCGLYCGDCVIKKSKVADQSKALLKEIRKGRFDKIGPGLAKVLDAFKPLRNIEQCCACLRACFKILLERRPHWPCASGTCDC